MLAHVLLAFLFPQLPQNDTIPQGVVCHTTINRKVFRNLSFYWHQSGFYNDSKDRLQSEMKIAIGLGLLKSTVQDFFQRLIILAACQKAMKIVLHKKNEYALIKSQVVHV